MTVSLEPKAVDLHNRPEAAGGVAPEASQSQWAVAEDVVRVQRISVQIFLPVWLKIQGAVVVAIFLMIMRGQKRTAEQGKEGTRHVVVVVVDVTFCSVASFVGFCLHHEC